VISFIDGFNGSTKDSFYMLMDDATWTRSDGSTRIVKVEFNSQAQDDELGKSINIQEPTAGVYAEDVPGLAVNNELFVQGDEYTIVDILPTGDGWIDLMLRKIL
jgi:hypothetical protein